MSNVGMHVASGRSSGQAAQRNFVPQHPEMLRQVIESFHYYNESVRGPLGRFRRAKIHRKMCMLLVLEMVKWERLRFREQKGRRLMNPCGEDVGLDRCYQRPAEFSVEEVAGETLVLDDQQGRVHQLNPTASFIWKRCDGRTSVQQIVNTMTDMFDVEFEVACRDVTDAVAKLRKLNLLSE